MSTKKVQRVSTKTIAKPVRVKFKTKSGETVSFKAVKTLKKPVDVSFRRKTK
jgi:hypothetical protein